MAYLIGCLYLISYNWIHSRQDDTITKSKKYNDNLQNIFKSKLDPLSFHFYLQDFHRNMISNFGCLATQFADMNQSVLLDADVHEAPERCNIRNGTSQHRAWLQIGHLLYATLEQRFHIGVVTIVSVQFTAQRLQYTGQLRNPNA